MSAVGEDATPVPPAAPLALRATPNPFENSTKIHFTLRSEGETRVTVHDVTGRLVRELHRGWLQAGRHTIPWDGRDESGRFVAAGIYLLGLKSGVSQVGSKVFRIR